MMAIWHGFFSTGLWGNTSQLREDCVSLQGIGEKTFEYILYIKFFLSGYLLLFEGGNLEDWRSIVGAVRRVSWRVSCSVSCAFSDAQGAACVAGCRLPMQGVGQPFSVAGVFRCGSPPLPSAKEIFALSVLCGVYAGIVFNSYQEIEGESLC